MAYIWLSVGGIEVHINGLHLTISSKDICAHKWLIFDYQ